MVKFKYYPNSINESDITDLLERISSINTYGYVIKNYLEKEEFEVIFTDEDSLYIEDPYITDLITRRGYAKYNKIVIHCTRYEIKESIQWLFLHELGHQILSKSFPVASILYFVNERFYRDIGLFNGELEYYSQVPGWAQEYHKDEIHEKVPEEILVSDFATSLISKNYSRRWWRDRINKVDVA